MVTVGDVVFEPVYEISVLCTIGREELLIHGSYNSNSGRVSISRESHTAILDALEKQGEENLVAESKKIRETISRKVKQDFAKFRR